MHVLLALFCSVLSSGSLLLLTLLPTRHSSGTPLVHLEHDLHDDLHNHRLQPVRSLTKRTLTAVQAQDPRPSSEPLSSILHSSSVCRSHHCLQTGAYLLSLRSHSRSLFALHNKRSNLDFRTLHPTLTSNHAEKHELTTFH
jgi:hypothetical protein